MSTGRKARKTPSRVPVMQATRYDKVTALLIALTATLALIVTILVLIWLTNLLPTNVPKEPLLTSGDGGWEDGSPDETLDVESPYDPTDDPSVVDDPAEVSELMQVVESVVTVSESATALVLPNEFTGSVNKGNPGSAEGTGGKPLGSGGPGSGGAKRDQRFIVEFADKGDLKSYARQLDFFGIELGALLPAESRMVYLSNMSTNPVTRSVSTGDAEKRLYMNWQGGERKEADYELFSLVNIDATKGVVLHFYPAETEQMLIRLEREYAGRPAAQIRRTYYQVEQDGGGYKFVVTNQKYR